MKTALSIFLVLTVCLGALQAQKRVVKSGIEFVGTTFHIKNVAAGRYLDLPGAGTKAKKDNGTFVQLWDLDQGEDRKVTFIPAGDGYYLIRFQHTQANLDVHGCFKDKLFCGTYKNENGAEAQIWKHGGGNEPQQWKPVQVKPGQFKLVNRYSGKVLDASASNIRKNGCKVQIWKWNGTDNQIWEFVDVQSGTRYQE